MARSGVLDGASPVKDVDVETLEWFYSEIKSEEIELVWDRRIDGYVYRIFRLVCSIRSFY